MAMCYAGVQVCLVTFLSPMLVEDGGLSLVAAGTMVALAQAAGGIGRPIWGLAADLLRSKSVVLSVIGIAAAIAFFTLTFFVDGGGWWLIAVVVIVSGGTAVGWNGVFARCHCRRLAA